MKTSNYVFGKKKKITTDNEIPTSISDIVRQEMKKKMASEYIHCLVTNLKDFLLKFQYL